MIVSGEKVEPKVGNSMPLENIPVGLMVHNVELEPERWSTRKICRNIYSIERKRRSLCYFKSSFGQIRKVSIRSRATIGQLGIQTIKIFPW